MTVQGFTHRRVSEQVFVLTHRLVMQCPSSWWPGFSCKGASTPEERPRQGYSTTPGCPFRKSDFMRLDTTWLSAVGVEIPDP